MRVAQARWVGLNCREWGLTGRGRGGFSFPTCHAILPAWASPSSSWSCCSPAARSRGRSFSPRRITRPAPSTTAAASPRCGRAWLARCCARRLAVKPRRPPMARQYRIVAAEAGSVGALVDHNRTGRRLRMPRCRPASSSAWMPRPSARS